MNDPLPRLIDRCRWQPLAWINDYGAPEREMPVALFMVVAEVRVTILRMRGDEPPLYGQPMINRPR